MDTMRAKTTKTTMMGTKNWVITFMTSLGTGNWKIETGNSKLEIRNWKLEVGS
jgi:hypothetical protein